MVYFSGLKYPYKAEMAWRHPRMVNSRLAKHATYREMDTTKWKPGRTTKNFIDITIYQRCADPQILGPHQSTILNKDLHRHTPHLGRVNLLSDAWARKYDEQLFLDILPQQVAESYLLAHASVSKLTQQRQHCSKIMKLPQSLPLQMAEHSLELSQTQ